MVFPSLGLGVQQGSIHAVLPNHRSDASFLDSGSQAAAAGGASVELGEAAASREDLPPEFYRGFAEAESTYDEAVANGRPDEYQSGWEPAVRPLADTTYGVRSEFFRESGSPGAAEAWQTHYPQVGNGPGTRQKDGNGAPWVLDKAGHWYQPYGSGTTLGSVHGDSNGLPAGWFDSAAYSRDGYGRPQAPLDGSPKRHAGWVEQTVNTTVTCAERGCIANTTLQLPFNWRKDQARNCKLSFSVHATDFDEDHSNEKVEWLLVNNVTVKTGCTPMASGCAADDANMLHPCLVEYPLDTEALLPWDGLLDVAAKISEDVDECPYQGNLLSGVVWATCLVYPQDPSPLRAPATNQPIDTLTAFDDIPEDGEDADPYSKFVFYLNCDTPGCTAKTTIEFALVGDYRECFLNVSATQTDFDNDESLELIEYIIIDGQTVAEGVNPGRNPCKESIAGSPMAEEEKTYLLVKDTDVTNEVLVNTRLTIEGKISQAVDECAADGHLLAGLIEITCSRIL